MYHQVEHSEILYSAHNYLRFFKWISEQRAIISLYAINFYNRDRVFTTRYGLGL